MTFTLEELNRRKDCYGDLYLSGCTGLTSLPEGLTANSLDLSGCTGLTSLPEGLTAKSLDLSGCTGLTSLPEGLTANYLYLSGCTGITNRSEQRKKVKKLSAGYVPGKYLYCDGILRHISRVKKAGKYTLYIGKIPGFNAVSDGTNFAHCDKFRDGISDLIFKTAKDRGANQYKGMSLDTELTVEEMVTMYRIITGACRQGSESFVQSLGPLKDKYSIREALELTKGQYGSEKFSDFFQEE